MRKGAEGKGWGARRTRQEQPAASGRNIPCSKQTLRNLQLVQKRFVWDDSVDPPRVRAAQGHTVALEEPVLEPVLDAGAVPLALHVTSTSRCMGG